MVWALLVAVMAGHLLLELLELLTRVEAVVEVDTQVSHLLAVLEALAS
jgi:hypothetical protein